MPKLSKKSASVRKRESREAMQRRRQSRATNDDIVTDCFDGLSRAMNDDTLTDCFDGLSRATNDDKVTDCFDGLEDTGLVKPSTSDKLPLNKHLKESHGKRFDHLEHSEHLGPDIDTLLLNKNEHFTNKNQSTPLLVSATGMPDIINVLTFGSFHQGSTQFSVESRGRQCTCTSLMMLVMSAEHKKLTPEVLDSVLIQGDQLYRSTVDSLKSNGTFRHHFLNFDELCSTVSTPDFVHVVQKHESIIGTILHSDEFGMTDLEKALLHCFQITGTCLLMVGSICSAVFWQDGSYYFYDSHSHGLDGLSSSDGRAVVAKFCSVNSLLSYLYSFYHSLNLLHDNAQYDLLPVAIGSTAKVAMNSWQMFPSLRVYFDTQAQESACFKAVKKVNAEQSHVSFPRKQYMTQYKQKQRQSESQKEKERKWKQEQRADDSKRAAERKTETHAKQRARSDPQKRAVERMGEKHAKQLARSDPQKRAAERKAEKHAKQHCRLDPKRRATVRKTDKNAKQRARSDPQKRAAERIAETHAKQHYRLDPKKRATVRKTEKNAKHRARSDPQKRAAERIAETHAKQRARSDPQKRAAERIAETHAKHCARSDPQKRAAERIAETHAKHCARSDPQKRAAERIAEKHAKQHCRLDPKKRATVRKTEKNAKQRARSDPQKRAAERIAEKKTKQRARSDPQKRSDEQKVKQHVRADPQKRKREREAEQKRKYQSRKDSTFCEIERLRKRTKRLLISMTEQEKLKHRTTRAEKRQNKEVAASETIKRKRRQMGGNLNECIGKFNSNIAEGPVYVCTCCNQTWFRHSVTSTDTLHSKLSPDDIQLYLTGVMSVDDKEWICRTCSTAIKEGRTPKLSLANKMCFPEKPEELHMHQLEERLVALRIPFMQIRELPRGGQLSIRGNVVNVPVDIQPTVTSLPRPFDENVTVPVQLKRKLQYKTCEFTENVRPAVVFSALHWLMNHSELYKNSGITINRSWLADVNETATDTVRELLLHETAETSQNLATTSQAADSLRECSQHESADASPNRTSTFGTNTRGASSSAIHAESQQKEYDSDTFSEVDFNQSNAGNSDTLLDEANILCDKVYTFAPGEGQQPLSLYQDSDAEYLAFPTIYCGQRRVDNKDRPVNLHYSDIAKWEVRCCDRRCANCVPNLFFKMKKLAMKQISDRVYLALRRCKTKGKKLTAGMVLDPTSVESLVRLDEGYYIFRTIRNSPPYLEARKKDLFAMIRQLGLPTWFGSFSSADTRWEDLLRMLAKLNLGKNLTDDNVKDMSWTEKTKLVQQDPVTCTRYFEHRVQEFIKTVLKSDHNPIGELKDYFYRVEFQQRGSPHIHMLMWITDAPKYTENPDEEVVAFIDQYVSCSRYGDVSELVALQTHKHSKSCRKKGKAVCRFGFPQPPMKNTTILTPLDEECQKYKKLYATIQKQLNDLTCVENLTFEEFLMIIDISEQDYMKAVRSSIDGPKVFIQRTPAEARVNAYIKPLLCAWRANHDLQFVLDPFACAVYIVSYISKSQRGMSMLLDQACKEARQGNMDLRRQVRHMGNKFLNSVEVSAQEAAYLILQLPLTRSTRDVVFINTSPPEERTFLLKDQSVLKNLPNESTNIEADNIIKRYSKRPHQLQNWCLADYVSELDVVFPKSETDSPDMEFNDDDCQDFEPEGDENGNLFKITLKNGIVIRQRRNPRVIRYVRYNKANDPENFFREKILLFLPWRDEERDVRGQFGTFEEHYNQFRNVINAKCRKYEHHFDELNAAMQQAEAQEYDHLAPGTEQTEQEDVAKGSVESENFVYFNPDRPENQTQYDIGQDLGLPAAAQTADVEANPLRMPKEQYMQLCRSLNVKQKEFVLHTVHWIKTVTAPLYAFLTGGAGVGKSVVIRVLYEALNRYLSSTEGQDPNNCRVLLCAPTGKSAYNISGSTIHAAFKIPASQGFHCKPINSDSLNTLRTKYRDLSVVIIDEVSMVGHSMLRLINDRLKQIKGTNANFGGVSVILIGDLYQLQPVMDGWIFQNLRFGLGPLATNLWQDLFTMHELTDIMRQKDDKSFSELLNRLRTGEQTQDDIDTLKTQMTDATSPNYPETAPHLFILNKSVDAFNTNLFNTTDSEKTIVPSLDSVVGDISSSVKEKLLQTLGDDSSKSAGLSKNIHLALGLKYDITANLDVEDGLTNGTTCVVENIDRRQNTARPSIIWVLFEEESVGKLRRQKYSHLYKQNTDRKWTPVFDIQRSFNHNRRTVIRIQFPLRLSAAKTVHKSQGYTLNEVVVDLSSARKFPHIHYVALSRVKSLSGLHILQLDENKMSVANVVTEEMKRLSKEARLTLCYTPVYKVQSKQVKVAFLNTRSLNRHIKDVQSDPNLAASDIMAFAETRLIESDSDDQFSIQGYSVIRNDATTNQLPNQRPHHGLAIYVKQNPTLHFEDIHRHSEPDIEFMLTTVVLLHGSFTLLTVYVRPGCTLVTLKSRMSALVLPTLKIGVPLVVVGDFNVDIQKHPTHYLQFMETAFSSKQIVQKPTHDSGSTLDHIFTNIADFSTDVIETHWSDHKIVYIAFSLC